MHASPTPPPTVQRENSRALRPFPIAVAAVLLIQAPYAYAQHKSAPTGPSETEKAKAQEKRAFEKDTDEAYKAMLSKTPESHYAAVDAVRSVTW